MVASLGDGKDANIRLKQQNPDQFGDKE